MTPDELRSSYLNFMQKRGFAVVPSASLLPENDPTTLFTGSGMQPMVPYLLGETHPAGDRIVDVQKCVRTGDIEETGDNSHLTFFEMIGDWVLGGEQETFKSDQIRAMWDWQIGELGLDPQRLYVSVYQGNEEMGIPRDDEAIRVWTELFESVGIEAKVEDEAETYGMSRGGRIFVYDEGENWWSRAGVPANMPVGEPGGPDSEMFFDFDPTGDEMDHPATDTPRFLEIGNNVFMAYKREESGFVPLPKPNIDYGGGLERISAALNGDPDVYLSPFFTNPIKKLEELSGTTYAEATRGFRIVLDHTRAATFLIADGAAPSNVDAGYITRRLIRRAIREARKLGIANEFMTQLAAIYIDEAKAYPSVQEAKTSILAEIEKEEGQFQKSIVRGENEIGKLLERGEKITGEKAFWLFETYGFPLELTEEILTERGIEFNDKDGFDTAAQKHSELSRTASAGKFKGGLADHSDETTALHTAAHLMLEGMRRVLGDHVEQRGSNITAERLRFDFSHGEKMNEEQVAAVEAFVNDAIKADARQTIVEMPKEEAKASGATGMFWEKYPDVVKVYQFEDAEGKIWSREICGGPHVEHTNTMGTFRIKKQEASSAGVRRVKAVLEK